MKLAISGGRHYKFTDNDIKLLDSIIVKHNITEIVSGGASGADTEAKFYALGYGIKFTEFPANWHKFGRSAGWIRNRNMAIYADAVLLFPGGKGTESMYGFAVEHKCRVLDYRKGVTFV
jgi:hypothetical protein